jgi:regulatory protein
MMSDILDLSGMALIWDYHGIMQEANSTTRPPFNGPAGKAENKRKTPKIPKKITEDYLSNSGKFYLERFPASVEQFKRVMGRKIQKSCKAHPEQEPGTCLALLDKVVDKFRAIGFLNDEGYSSGLARSLKSRGWPKGRIIMRLKEKGISAELIEKIFEDHNPGDDIFDALVCMKRKRLGPFATREKPFDKELASMGRAGFDYNAANRALKMSKEDVEDMLKNRYA